MDEGFPSGSIVNPSFCTVYRQLPLASFAVLNQVDDILFVAVVLPPCQLQLLHVVGVRVAQHAVDCPPDASEVEGPSPLSSGLYCYVYLPGAVVLPDPFKDTKPGFPVCVSNRPDEYPHGQFAERFELTGSRASVFVEP